MSRARFSIPKSTINEFYERVKGGEEFTADRIENEYFGDVGRLITDKATKVRKRQILIKKTRDRLHREDGDDWNFYYSGRTKTYKLIGDDVLEEIQIDNKMRGITTGFIRSTNRLLKAMIYRHPELGKPFYLDWKNRFELAGGMLIELEETFKKGFKEEVKKLEDGN